MARDEIERTEKLTLENMLPIVSRNMFFPVVQKWRQEEENGMMIMNDVCR